MNSPWPLRSLGTTGRRPVWAGQDASRSDWGRSTRLPLGLWLALTALACAACAGEADTDEAPGPTSEPITVIGEFTAFDEPVYEAQAGTVEFSYENRDNLVHTLVVEGREADMSVEVELKGEIASGAIELEPGEYVLYCDVEGHRAAGMVSNLVVS